MKARKSLLADRRTDEQLVEQLLAPVWRKTSLAWLLLFGIASLGTALYACAILYTVFYGIGTWGNNIPAAWGFGITDFVFWIEIAHAGTFISAVLLLLEQGWRTSINRIAEAMTIFAVVQAGIFPLLHMGRPWFFYWLIPYPSTMDVWPQWKSSLTWDVAAVPTYAFASLLFWYLGMIPDLAAIRDRAPGKLRRILYGIFALGWTGSARAYLNFRLVYGLLAALITLLVIVVISTIGSDFAIGIVPGFHSTIFPPYFVVVALYSGFALVTTLLVLTRAVFRMQNVITTRHLDVLGKMLLAMGSATLFSYFVEFFTGWYSGDPYERYYYFHEVWRGPNAWVWWMTIGGTIVSQLFWWKKMRTAVAVLFTISIAANFGMWGDRFGFVVMSLQRDFLPSSWRAFGASWVDWSLLVGSVSCFLFLYLLFIRFVPFVPVSELEELRRDLREHGT